MLNSIGKLRILLPVALLTAACSYLAETDPSSPFYIPTTGTRVIVNKPIEVPPGRTLVFLQLGKIIPRKNLNEYEVNCNFEIRTMGDKPRYIKPGTYTVIKIQRATESIVDNSMILLASATLRTTLFDRGDVSMMFEVIRMKLDSGNKSDLYELACRGAIDDPIDMALPTLAEIRQALGEYASIKTPEEN